MPTGIIDINDRGITIRLLENLAAAQSAPADGAPADRLHARPASTQFYELADLYTVYQETYGVRFEWPDVTTVRLYETAGSGTMTLAYARLWLYDALAQKALPAGIGADATKGYLNGGSSFGETGSDKLRHAEPLMYPGHCDGINIELGTFGGTSPTFNVDWFVPAPRFDRAVVSMLDEMRDQLRELIAVARDPNGQYTI